MWDHSIGIVKLTLYFRNIMESLDEGYTEIPSYVTFYNRIVTNGFIPH